MRVIFSLWLLSQLHACSGALLVTPRPDIAQATRTLIPTPTRIDPREILAIVSDEEETFFLLFSFACYSITSLSSHSGINFY
jgi:hypothetical protein